MNTIADRPNTLELEPELASRKIFVPIDFSNCSRKAIQYAEGLAAEFGGEITLAHVVRTYPTVPDMPSATTEMNTLLCEEAAKKLEKWKGEIRRVPCRAVVRTGHPVQEIVREAERMGADIIVIATHGRGPLEHAFLGSVAERIARHASCPVLVVREKEHDFLSPPKKEQ